MASFSSIYKITQDQYDSLRQHGSFSAGGSIYQYYSQAIYLVDGGGHVEYDISVSSWSGNSPSINQELYYAGYMYYKDISIAWATADTVVEVIFNAQAALSGNYAAVCYTGQGYVRIFAKVNNSIVIPTIKEII